MTITEQARGAAEEIARRWFDGDLPERAQLQSLAREQLTTLVEEVIKRVHPASVTEAIDCVKRLRDEWQNQASGMDSVKAVLELRKWGMLMDRVATCDQIITALKSLQGKAGVNELRKWRCNNCWNVNVQQPCAKCGRPEEVAVLPPHAATTPASVEAKLCSICIAAGRVYCPPEHRQAYDITGEELTTTAPPEQQSPRVCVSGDGDKSESD